MARTKKLPNKVVDYDNLSADLKSIYDKIYAAYYKKNIFKLREEAQQMSVESPTTLSKEELVKRMTDKIISDYLPPEDKKSNSWGVMSGNVDGKRVRGIFEDYGGTCYVGRVLVPIALARDLMLRSGDLVEGIVSEIAGGQTLVAVNTIEDEAPIENRRWFSDIPTRDRRPFGSVIAGTKADLLLPGLQMGERVIISNMTREDAKEIARSFPIGIGLFAGLEPEYESDLNRGNFVIAFDCTKSESLKVAHLTLDRAKRLCERGKDVVIVIYGFDSLGDRDTERALFGAGRCFDKGSLTVIADVAKDKDCGIYSKIATRIIEK